MEDDSEQALCPQHAWKKEGERTEEEGERRCGMHVLLQE